MLEVLILWRYLQLLSLQSQDQASPEATILVTVGGVVSARTFVTVILRLLVSRLLGEASLFRILPPAPI